MLSSVHNFIQKRVANLGDNAEPKVFNVLEI